MPQSSRMIVTFLDSRSQRVMSARLWARAGERGRRVTTNRHTDFMAISWRGGQCQVSLTVGLSRERVNDVLSSPVIALEPGTRIDVYRLIRPLGKGGFAEVWEAKNEADGRHVALKVLT